jgi:hypothetical protein
LSISFSDPVVFSNEEVGKEFVQSEFWGSVRIDGKRSARTRYEESRVLTGAHMIKRSANWRESLANGVYGVCSMVQWDVRVYGVISE